MEKELEKNVELITKDIKSYIPDNIVEIIASYAFSFLMALLIFLIGKWITNKIVVVLGKVLRKVKGMIRSRMILLQL